MTRIEKFLRINKGVIMIKLKHINKYYGDFHVTKDLNLHVKKGEIYGLIGKNGAGKTTIFKIILGLSDFSDGELSIKNSKNYSELLTNRKKIGFFIGKNFFDYLDAKENLQYYRKLKGIKDKKEIERVLKIVGLNTTKAKYKSFSMGMKQRLGIASALLGNPEILILDEPTNGLDPQGIVDIRNLVKQLNQEYGMTIIVSSHILGELEHTANRFGIVHEGKVLREITLDDLKSESDTIQISVNDIDRTREILKSNHIEILAEKSSTKTLEDYYFELVGGKIK
ncbi:ATP-binding cassette domain-containing protein [Clostridium botulinum]|nr:MULTISPECIES: ATP-binding cassette domain-containing protein [unclassified Clostridium]NFG62552.1 ATP-binding cassette domain-containing protein [Clostridium botulinum]NFQ10753.1 ATP-binding cassette domain-containing protein [Clostridium botulinum]